MKNPWIFRIVFTLLTLTPLGLMSYKLLVLDYHLTDLMPAVSYHVDITMQVNGHGDDTALHTYLPKSDARQQINDEENSSGMFALSIQSDGNNRIATWRAENVSSQHTLRYSLSARILHVRYRIPENMPIPNSYPPELERYLVAEPGVQVDDPLVAKAIEKILPNKPLMVLDVLTRIHRYLQDQFKNKNFSGFTDALTALKLGEASCNGKGRLFVAMTRKLGLPARLVGGLILQPGTKRVSHQWVEVYISGHWVPFDTINDHFAELPGNFLTLYYGDLALFKHSRNINFQYLFKTAKRLVPKAEVKENIGNSPLNIMNIYTVFERIGIPQNLLKIILMLPLGALVTVIFRNVIGVETFGTFLPALIASAARDSGLLWGMVGFVFIIITISLLRRILDWMQLLHSPKMAILLTCVVILMLSMTSFGVYAGLFELAHVSLFPIAILAITAERFAILDEEEGFTEALKITGVTMIVIAAAYVVMDSLFLQSMILAFPELLLITIALNMWLGKWIGIRVLEFIRFRRLILAQSA